MTVIKEISDGELKKYIPNYGDRLLLVSFCKKHDTNEATCSRINLMKHINNPSEHNKRSTKQLGNRNALKRRRRVQLGWFNFNDEKKRYTQVKTKKGGGLRSDSYQLDTTMAAFIDEGTKLFFPKGTSKFGDMNEFEFKIIDSCLDIIDLDTTVAELYAKRKDQILKIYLSSKAKVKEIELSTSEETLEPVTKKQETYQVESSDILNEAMKLADIMTYDTTDDDNLPDIFFQSNVSALVGDLDETIPMMETINLHRGHVFEELLNYGTSHSFNSSTTYHVEMILPNGHVEQGADTGGVFRDALTEFWNSFYDLHTVGDETKVPIISHKMGEDRWKAIAEIMVIGHKQEHYLPIFISKSFLRCCLGNDVSDDDLVKEYMQVLPACDSQIISEAIRSFNDVDTDELLDILSTYGAKVMPSESNILRVITEMAHKEIIQGPAFISKCWMPILNYFLNIDLDKVYNDLKLSPRKVVALLKFPETDSMTASNLAVMNNLKRFVKSCNEDNLKSFLRFCTGM